MSSTSPARRSEILDLAESSRTAGDASGRVSGGRASETEKASRLLRARRGKFTGKISGKSRRGRQERWRARAMRARDRASSPPLSFSSPPPPSHYRIPPATSSFLGFCALFAFRWYRLYSFPDEGYILDRGDSNLVVMEVVVVIVVVQRWRYRRRLLGGGTT